VHRLVGGDGGRDPLLGHDAFHVFDYDDRVVHHDPDREHQAEQREQVDEKPSTCIPKKAPITETGTATTGMRVARQLCRKTNTTNVTRAKASNRVFTTSLIDSVT